MRQGLLEMNVAAKNTSVAFIIASTISLWLSGICVAAEPTVMVKPNPTSAAIGATFSVNVTIVDVENLYGVEMILEWNSTVLHLVTVKIQLGEDDGALNAPIYIAENSTLEGRYTISATSANPALPFNGTGNIVELDFCVVSAGTSIFEVQSQLYDYPPPDRDPRLSIPIAHVDVDGLFQNAISEFSSYLVLVAAWVFTFLAALLCKHIFSRYIKTFNKPPSNRIDI